MHRLTAKKLTRTLYFMTDDAASPIELPKLEIQFYLLNSVEGTYHELGLPHQSYKGARDWLKGTQYSMSHVAPDRWTHVCVQYSDFPDYVFVREAITVEAWNSDFRWPKFQKWLDDDLRLRARKWN